MVLVVAVALLAVGQWRLDLSDRLGLEPNPRTDPGAVSPPAGLQLAEQPAARRVAPVASAGRLNPAAVRRALAPYVADHALGKRVDVLVADLDGTIVYRRGDSAVRPASTMKLLTSTAALQVLGPMRRFSTTVDQVPGSRRIVLVGGGDPFLASTAKRAKGLYPQRATTAELAARTAAALRREGVGKVRLGYDASLFTGPAVNPAWPSTYLPEDVVPPISALWVDEAEDGAGHYVSDPAAAAAAVFAGQLRAAGVKVLGSPTPRTARPAGRRIAAVRSAPLGEIVQRLLTVSDNNAAEVVLRHVGIAIRNDGSFAGGTTAVRTVLGRLGIPTRGLRMHDGSGLSREDRLRPQTLVALFRTAASPAHPRLRDVVTGLPVAGFSGSLAGRYRTAPHAGLGRVRAKTGTLTGVSGLAGVAVDLDGTPLIFAALTDRVPVADTLGARQALDRITAALGACHCGASRPTP